jgi:hypothetical protein
MRANSLTNLGVSIERDIASGFDLIQEVAGIASEIEALAPHADEIATIVANLPDVTTVQQANEVLNNLTVSVTTLPTGSMATAELVGTEVQLGIPRGATGADGYDGVTPVVEFTVDGAGNLQYEVVDYIDINTGNTMPQPIQEEW